LILLSRGDVTVSATFQNRISKYHTEVNITSQYSKVLHIPMSNIAK
jgi:hypothetical protein